MCGIIGVVSRAGGVEREQLRVGRDALQHRGPDDCGEWWSEDGTVGLGHRRLSIIDTTEGGRQPMSDSSGNSWVVYNGEIYNFQDLRRELEMKGHSFRSHSDTEVLLAAYLEWGTSCVTRLNGMFAFALYDSRNRRLFAARDRAGEKPFFYAASPQRFAFASELKGLLAADWVERKMDPEALNCLLAMGYIPGDRCILRGTRKLPPGHALSYEQDTGELKVWRYWQVPELEVNSAQAGKEDESLLDDVESLLEDAVRRQLVADVPIGVLLSGGVDSSLVTAMAVRSHPKVKTFTIRFPGHSRYDETEHARLIARHFETDHVELEAESSSVQLLPALARQFDEPMVDSSMIPTFLVSRLVREHCTVVLGGDGGDELFGGYGHHSRLLWTKARTQYVPKALRAVLANAARSLMPVGAKGRNWLQGLACDWNHGLPQIAVGFDWQARRKLLANHSCLTHDVAKVWSDRVPKNSDLLQRATRMDFANYLPEDILVKVDRASMLNSLEVRAPFLDYRVVEFAFKKVPSALKATTSQRKILLKMLAARVLPPAFDMQRKHGFSIPLRSWLQGEPWRSFFRDTLLGQNNGFFNRPTVEKLFKGQSNGCENSERLFGLVMFELWRTHYNTTL